MSSNDVFQEKARCLDLFSIAIKELFDKPIPDYNPDIYGVIYDYLPMRLDFCGKHLYELLNTPLIEAFGFGDSMSPFLVQKIITSIETDIELDIDISEEVSEKLIKFFRENPKEIYNSTPRQFEEIIQELFDGFGFSTEITKRTRDGGFDVIAIRSYETNVRYLVECKRNSPENKVNIGIVKKLHSTKTDELATKGILVTTSYFTKPAKAFIERHKWELDGKDFDGLMNWIRIYLEMKNKNQ